MVQEFWDPNIPTEYRANRYSVYGVLPRGEYQRNTPHR